MSDGLIVIKNRVWQLHSYIGLKICRLQLGNIGLVLREKTLGTNELYINKITQATIQKSFNGTKYVSIFICSCHFSILKFHRFVETQELFKDNGLLGFRSVQKNREGQKALQAYPILGFAIVFDHYFAPGYQEIERLWSVWYHSRKPTFIFSFYFQILKFFRQCSVVQFCCFSKI